jgi:hypothetical protein
VLLSYHEIEAAPADFGEAPNTFITLHPSPARRIRQPTPKGWLAAYYICSPGKEIKNPHFRSASKFSFSLSGINLGSDISLSRYKLPRVFYAERTALKQIAPLDKIVSIARFCFKQSRANQSRGEQNGNLKFCEEL